ECGKQGKEIPAWLERKHRKAARIKKSRKMGSDDDEDDDNEIVSFEEIAATRNHTYEAPLSSHTTDNSSPPTPGQAQSNSLMDDDDDFVQPDGSPMPQDINMQEDVKESLVDDYNFQLDDGLFSGVGHDRDNDPFHSMPTLAEVSDEDDDDDTNVNEISTCHGSGLNDLLDQNMASLLCHASLDGYLIVHRSSTQEQTPYNGIKTNHTKENPAVSMEGSLAKISDTLGQIIGVIKESTIAEERGKDDNPKFWATYKKVSTEQDDDFTGRANDDMGIILTSIPLLLFGLSLSANVPIGYQPPLPHQMDIKSLEAPDFKQNASIDLITFSVNASPSFLPKTSSSSHIFSAKGSTPTKPDLRPSAEFREGRRLRRGDGTLVIPLPTMPPTRTVLLPLLRTTHLTKNTRPRIKNSLPSHLQYFVRPNSSPLLYPHRRRGDGTSGTNHTSSDPPPTITVLLPLLRTTHLTKIHGLLEGLYPGCHT
ncbi:uncharacterized protein EDB93DRAFT_1110859, partial [Suillus bovinus]|uniref:uncharacterized protein n=1 Tax=Suillus bovinus TaxID=48563 RepID=UPI001B867743